ncbi:MAG: helix-turn-helix domain-containing protein [Candidatus Binatia bacterium]
MEEIITPSEVAVLLRIHVKTVYRLADQGLIPGNRIGRNWRFRKSNILALVSDQQRRSNEDSLGDKKLDRQS